LIDAYDQIVILHFAISCCELPRISQLMKLRNASYQINGRDFSVIRRLSFTLGLHPSGLWGSVDGKTPEEKLQGDVTLASLDDVS
jgi:hypothetical protein